MTGQPGLLQFLLDDELALLDELAAEQPLAAGVPPLPPLVVPPIATGSAAHDAAAMPPLPAAPSAAGTSWPGGGAMTAGPAADTAQPACSSVRHGGDGDGGSGSGDGSGASRRRRGRAGKESAEERERQRALQRAYQARYMQRKQARQRELQEQLAALEGEVQRERQRTEELQNASCVLGAVLQVHEAAFNILRATGGPPAGSRPAGAAPFSSEGGSNTGAAAVNGSAPAPSPAMAALECLPASRDSGASATAALGVASRLMTLPFQQRSEVFCSQLRVSSPDLEGQLRTAPDSFAFDLRAQRELSRHLDLGDPGLVDGLCSLTPQAVCQDYADFGDYVAATIALLDSGGLAEDEAVERLLPAFQYQTAIHTLLLKHNFAAYRLLMMHTMTSAPSEELEIGVSRAQAAALLPHYTAYRARQAELGAEWATIMDRLLAVQEQLARMPLPVAAAGLSAAAGQFCELTEALNQLSLQPDAALKEMLGFYQAAGTVATLLQKARLVARCRPLDPDIGAIVGEALAHHGLLPAPAAPAPAPGAASGAGGQGAGADGSARVAAESVGRVGAAVAP